ncbi:MAG: hypothetical protein GF398_03850 [Chitinivibrionales bacterium]|nr:hypothetical protein [Chitinivibrionales bacterium]
MWKIVLCRALALTKVDNLEAWKMLLELSENGEAMLRNAVDWTCRLCGKKLLNRQILEALFLPALPLEQITRETGKRLSYDPALAALSSNYEEFLDCREVRHGLKHLIQVLMESSLPGVHAALLTLVDLTFEYDVAFGQSVLVRLSTKAKQNRQMLDKWTSVATRYSQHIFSAFIPCFLDAVDGDLNFALRLNLFCASSGSQNSQAALQLIQKNVASSFPSGCFEEVVHFVEEQGASSSAAASSIIANLRKHAKKFGISKQEVIMEKICRASLHLFRKNPDQFKHLAKDYIKGRDEKFKKLAQQALKETAVA